MKARTDNNTYPKVAVQWLNHPESFRECFYQSFCLVDSEVLKNRHLRVAVEHGRQVHRKMNIRTIMGYILTPREILEL